MKRTDGETLRLNRFLASCGLGSRRRVEKDLILAGRVTLNDRPVQNPAERVCSGDRVKVNEKVVTPCRKLYIVMNKPRGVVCSVRDRHSRTVLDILPDDLTGESPFPAGRLDKQSEGLLVLTNDGKFMQDLIHPSRGIPKTYHVLLDRRPTEIELESWRGGIPLGNRHLVPLNVRLLKETWLEITLGEGIKREIRIMAEHHGFRIKRLVRRSIGQMSLRHLPPGHWREMAPSLLWKLINEGGMV